MTSWNWWQNYLGVILSSWNINDESLLHSHDVPFFTICWYVYDGWYPSMMRLASHPLYSTTTAAGKLLAVVTSSSNWTTRTPSPAMVASCTVVPLKLLGTDQRIITCEDKRRKDSSSMLRLVRKHWLPLVVNGFITVIYDSKLTWNDGLGATACLSQAGWHVSGDFVVGLDASMNDSVPTSGDRGRWRIHAVILDMGPWIITWVPRVATQIRSQTSMQYKWRAKRCFSITAQILQESLTPCCSHQEAPKHTEYVFSWLECRPKNSCAW